MSNPQQHTVYVVAGPTAVGKTAVAIELAQMLDTAIVSADSRQCYREMSIGTAKPNARELASAKHYFIDEFPVTYNLSAADYEGLALGYLKEIFETRTTAVVCGGTGLYIKALCEGLDPMPETDTAISEEVEKAYNVNGLQWLQYAIAREDPEFYRVGEIHNPARVLRALAFVRSTGKSILSFRTSAKKERPFSIVKIGLELPRPILYRRINDRVDAMMELGLLQEVSDLLPYRDCKNLQTVGYSELFDYLDGKCTLEEAVEKIKQHTRNYAKRQLTWFRKDIEFSWYASDRAGIAAQILTNHPPH